jgi:predicted alpha/beta hydrolase
LALDEMVKTRDKIQQGGTRDDVVERIGAVAVRFLEAGSDRDGSLPRPAVVLTPAMGVPARYYLPFAEELRARAGAHVVLMDLRGHGESTPPPSRADRYGYRELVCEDLAGVVAATRSCFPAGPLVLVGHSLGGNLNSVYTACGDEKVDGLILVAACTPYYRCFGRSAARVLVGAQIMGALTRLVGHWPGDRLGFGGRQGAGVIRDWAYLARTGRYRVEGIRDVEAALARVRVPVLAITVEGDALAPRRAAEHLVGKLRCAAPVTWWHYTAKAAEVERLNHFRWIRHSGPLADRVAAWMDENGYRPA